MLLTGREKVFFESFSDFVLKSDSSSIAEFCRLAKTKGWVQGSDMFSSFWKACFDKDCPDSAGTSITKDDTTAAATGVDVRRNMPRAAKQSSRPLPHRDGDVTSLEKGLQSLDLHTSSGTSAVTSLHALTPASSIAEDGVLIRFFDTFPGFTSNNSAPLREEFDRLAEMQKWPKDSQLHRDQWTKCCADEFSSFYNNSRLEAWQGVYTDITGDITPPSTLNKCRKMLESYYVNILDFIDCKRAGIAVTPIFTTRSSFRRYTKKHKSVFPIDAAKQNPMLSILMENIFGGRQT